jgi:hypothetical protein
MPIIIIHGNAMKIFIIVIAVATLLGGFVAGELNGVTFMLTGAVIGGVGTAAVLLGLGAFFTAQEERKRKTVGTPPLTPEIREVFARMAGRPAATQTVNQRTPNDKSAVYMKTVSGLIRTQLLTSFPKPKDAFPTLMTNKRAAGYVFGLSDAMLQACGLRADKDKAKELMETCYKDLFGDSCGHALLSMSLQGQNNEDFHAGRMEGGSEMTDFIERKVPPLGLTRILLGEAVTETASSDESEAAWSKTEDEFETLVFEIQRVFRRLIEIPPTEDKAIKVFDNCFILDAIIPFAYGLILLRLSKTDSNFIDSTFHEKTRLMAEGRLVKNRLEGSDAMIALMPKLPDGASFQPKTAETRKKVQEELRTTLDTLVDGGYHKLRLEAQSNLVRSFITKAPFLKEVAIKERLFAEMSVFSDSYIKQGLSLDFSNMPNRQ